MDMKKTSTTKNMTRCQRAFWRNKIINNRINDMHFHLQEKLQSGCDYIIVERRGLSIKQISGALKSRKYIFSVFKLGFFGAGAPIVVIHPILTTEEVLFKLNLEQELKLTARRKIVYTLSTKT